VNNSTAAENLIFVLATEQQRTSTEKFMMIVWCMLELLSNMWSGVKNDHAIRETKGLIVRD